MAEKFPKNTDNYSITNGFTVFFAEEQTDGSFDVFLPLGNIVDGTFSPIITELEHFSNFSGINAKDLEIIISVGGTFGFDIDEIVHHNLRYLFGSSGAASGTSITVPKTEQQQFTGAAPGTLNVNSSAAINSNIAVFDLDGIRFAETTDYTVTLSSGLYTRVGSGSIPVSGTVKVIYDVSQSATCYPIMDKPLIEGKVKIVNLAKDIGPAMMIEVNSAVVRLDGDIGFGKEDWRVATLQFEMLEDVNGDFGNIYNF